MLVEKYETEKAAANKEIDRAVVKEKVRDMEAARKERIEMLKVIVRGKEQPQIMLIQDLNARQIDMQGTIRELELRITKANLVMSSPHRNLAEGSEENICEMAVQILQTKLNSMIS